MSEEWYPFELKCFKHEGKIKYLSSSCDKCFDWSSLGLERNKKNDILIQVDVKNKIIEIKNTNFNSFSFELINVHGQVMFQKKILQKSEQITLPYDLKGIYIYRIIEKNEIVETGKVKL